MLQKIGRILQQEQNFLEKQLKKAEKAGDKERTRELQQALLDNQLAILDNTKALQETEGTINKFLDFNSTAWQLYRQAVLNAKGKPIYIAHPTNPPPPPVVPPPTDSSGGRFGGDLEDDPGSGGQAGPGGSGGSGSGHRHHHHHHHNGGSGQNGSGGSGEYGKIGGDTYIDVNITEPTEVADPTVLASTIGFKLSQNRGNNR